MKRPANGRLVLSGSAARASSAIAVGRGHAGLETLLEGVLVDAIAGRSAHEELAGTLRREARAVLLRHGLAGAEVGVEQLGTEFRVHVRLPGPTPRVFQVRVNVD